MKRFFQATTLLTTLLLGQQAFAQEQGRKQIFPIAQSTQTATPSASAKESRQKNQFYIPGFNRERFVQQLSKQYLGTRHIDYFSRNSADSFSKYTEFKDFKIDTRPFQLYDSGISLTFFPRRNNFRGNAFFAPRRSDSSVPNGIVRKLFYWGKK